MALLAVLFARPPAGAASGIYFTAVNDQLLSLSSSTMPIIRDGTVFVPYSVFNPDVAKVSVGVFYSRNTSENTITLFDKQKILTFDLKRGYSYTKDNAYTAKATARNGIIYIPVYFVCNYFGLDYSYLSTDQGPLIRIKNSSAVLSDYGFTRAAKQMMLQYLKEYKQSTAGEGKETAAPQPIPSSSGGGSPKPNASSAPSNAPTTQEPEKAGLVFLAFSCSASGTGKTLLDTLDAADLSAFFFFRPGDLAANDDLVRRMVGSGYGIGLNLTGNEGNAEAALAEGNALLASIARVSTRMLIAPNATNEQKAAWTKAGYIVWESNITSTYTGTSSYSMAQALEKKIDRKALTARVLLGDGGLTAGALPHILNYLNKNGYEMRPITETDR